MANEEHLARLSEGAAAWKLWRESNWEVRPDLIRAKLSGVDLKGAKLNGANLSEVVLSCAKVCEADFRNSDISWADFRKADLSGAKCSEANLYRTKFRGANLSGADFSGAKLSEADLSGADLRRTNFSAADLRSADLSKAKISGANLVDADLRRAGFFQADLTGANLSRTDLYQAQLTGANLSWADLSGANLQLVDLSGANLQHADLSSALLVCANLAGAQLDGSRVYGTSVWDVRLDKHTSQRDLVITPIHQDSVTVDDLEVAHFIYLLTDNKRIRKVIDTITSKVVLILGRFTEERKGVLDAMRNELRKHDFTPVLVDFDKPASRDLTETISTLAHMARFVIADITDAKSIPQELQKIVPNLPSLPVRPLILDGQYEYAMFKDFSGYLSVLPPFRYRNMDHLLQSLETEVIGPALNRAKEIKERRKAFEQESAKK